MSLFKYNSLAFLFLLMISCKASSEGQGSTKKNNDTASHEAHTTASTGTSNGESRAKDTPTTNSKAVHHGSPEQAKIDSIKQAKNAQKH